MIVKINKEYKVSVTFEKPEESLLLPYLDDEFDRWISADMPKEIVPDFPLKFVLSEGLILWKCESEIKIFSRRIKDALCVSPISARMYEKIYADKPANELANAEAEILSLMKGQLPLVDYMKYRSQIQAIWSLQAKAYR